MIPLQPVASPPSDADAPLLVDWLELTAFFSKRATARLDVIDNALTIQRNQEDQFDIADIDAAKDDRRSRIEEEVDCRAMALGNAYPFRLSDDGEELSLACNGRIFPSLFYISCLITSHFTKSRILLELPSPEEIRRFRNYGFPLIAALVMVGHTSGPAIMFGHPRPRPKVKVPTPILDVISHICRRAGTGEARQELGQQASCRINDGGMDVIAWRPSETGLPPPSEFYFVQVASGNNWTEKSAKDDLDDFLDGLFIEKPKCNCLTATVIPFRITQTEHNLYGRRHGHIFDRIRTPLYAMNGFERVQNDDLLLGGLNGLRISFSWLFQLRRRCLAE